MAKRGSCLARRDLSQCGGALFTVAIDAQLGREQVMGLKRSAFVWQSCNAAAMLGSAVSWWKAPLSWWWLLRCAAVAVLLVLHRGSCATQSHSASCLCFQHSLRGHRKTNCCTPPKLFDLLVDKNPSINQVFGKDSVPWKMRLAGVEQAARWSSLNLNVWVVATPF